MATEQAVRMHYKLATGQKNPQPVVPSTPKTPA